MTAQAGGSAIEFGGGVHCLLPRLWTTSCRAFHPGGVSIALLLHPVLQFPGFFRGEDKAEAGAAPEDVFRRQGPFLRHEVADLELVKVAAKASAHIVPSREVAGHDPGPGSVGPGQSVGRSFPGYRG